MKHTTSLKKNYEFKRLYNKGKNSASKYMAVYIRKNGTQENRLGITVSTKFGGAVKRNRIRRRLKEVYRLNEHTLQSGYDIVIVARMSSQNAKWSEINDAAPALFAKLGLTKKQEH